MKNSNGDNSSTLQYAIDSINSGYVKCEEPEYNPLPKERDHCKVPNLDDFKVKKF